MTGERREHHRKFQSLNSCEEVRKGGSGGKKGYFCLSILEERDRGRDRQIDDILVEITEDKVKWENRRTNVTNTSL